MEGKILASGQKDFMREQAHAFYARYGFIEAAQTANRMFLPTKTVEKLLEAKS